MERYSHQTIASLFRQRCHPETCQLQHAHDRWFFLRRNGNGSVPVVVPFPLTEFERSSPEITDEAIVRSFGPSTDDVDIPVVRSTVVVVDDASVFQNAVGPGDLVWLSADIDDRYEDFIIRTIYSALVNDNFRRATRSAFTVAFTSIATWPRTFKLLVLDYLTSIGENVAREREIVFNQIADKQQPGARAVGTAAVLSNASRERYEAYDRFFLFHLGRDADDGDERVERVFANGDGFLDATRNPYEVSRRLISTTPHRSPATLVALFDFLARGEGYAALVYWENKQFWKTLVRPRPLTADFTARNATGTPHGLLQRDILFELYGRPGDGGNIPPIRLDYADMRVILDADDADDADDGVGNKIVVREDGISVILREYKTARQYGECVIHHASPVLAEKIRRMMAMRDELGVDDEYADVFLLTEAALRPMTRNGLSKYLKKHFGGSVNQIRKKFVVDNFRPAGELRRRAATGMQHSLAVQDRDYNFFSDLFEGRLNPRGREATRETNAILTETICVINPFSEYNNPG